MLTHVCHCLYLSEKIDSNIFVDWRFNFGGLIQNRVNYFEKWFEPLPCWFDISQDFNKLKVNSSRVKIFPGKEWVLDPDLRSDADAHLFETLPFFCFQTNFDVVVSSAVMDFLPNSILYKLLFKLNFSCSIRSEVELLLANIPVPRSELIGVHFRHGNGELYEIGSEREKILFDSYFYVLDGVIDSGKKIFLVTDSQIVVNRFSERYKDVYTNPNVIYPSSLGKPMHHYGAHLDLNPEKTLETAVQDMYILSLLGGLVCDTWSSFSRYAKAVYSLQDKLDLIVAIKPPRKGVLDKGVL